MFTMQEAALAYAKAAERILGEDGEYINNNQELVPVFVSLLFQSLEISLKHLGIAISESYLEAQRGLPFR